MKEIQLIETLRVEEGRFLHPELHQKRMEESTQELFGHSWSLDFSSLSVPEHCRHGLVKCRVLYNRTLRALTFEPYTPRTIRSLRLVTAPPELDYHLKYADRGALEELRSLRQSCDEVIIVRNGALTDTSYSNLLFYDGNEYITPESYLLNGTCRQRLLREGRIREAHLTPHDLFRFKFAILINAMIGLEENITVPVEQIYE